MLALSFTFFLLLFITIGLWASRGKEQSDANYLTAGKTIPPILTGLSAGATTNSGFMFIGLIATVWAGGFHWVWLVMGFIIGDWLMSYFIYPHFHKEATRLRALTFCEVFAHWGNKKYFYVRILGASFAFLLLLLYAAAQLQAGSKAVSVMLGWDLEYGIWLGAFIVFSYCFAGGLRASIWTDAAQAIIMLLSMTLLLIYAFIKTGGVMNFIDQANQISPSYLNIFPPDLPFFDPITSTMLFIIGWIFGGFGTIGQPHIMVRYISMRSSEEMGQVRFYNYAWNFVFSLLAIGVGMAARILIPAQTGFDAELGLPVLSIQIMPAILAGSILAGVFSAALSTADSQILSCSATLSHDFTRKGRNPSFRANEFTTALIILAVVGVATFGNYLAIGSFSVFSLVLVSWAGLAVIFGPVLILYRIGCRPAQSTIILMMLTSFATILIWRLFPINDLIYAVMPGFIVGFLVYGLDLAFRGGNTAPDG